MKKLAMCLVVYLVTAVTVKPVMADETLAPYKTNGSSVDDYIAKIYKQIDFKGNRLSAEVFNKAMHGYLNLKNAGKLNTAAEMLTVCDLTRSSAENRMWIIDLAKKKVVYNTYVAHGQGSGDEFATAFSNNNDSHQTSLGFYVTGDTYQGEHGTSLRLNGMDNGFNNAAFDRGIVVHGAAYVCDQYAKNNQRIGRSWGCPAVPSALSLPIINTIKGGTCLFIFYPNKAYLQTAYWMNKKIDRLPDTNMNPEFAKSACDTVIQYISRPL